MPFAETASRKTGLVIDRQSHTIRLTRSFDAPRAEIFEAWTSPEHVARWWDPAGKPLTACEIDLRPGGSFKFVTKDHPDMPFAGAYSEIAPPGRLVFEALGATGRVMLEEAHGGARMTVEIECRSADAARPVSQDGRRRRDGADARQSRRLCAAAFGRPSLKLRPIRTASQATNGAVRADAGS